MRNIFMIVLGIFLAATVAPAHAMSRVIPSGEVSVEVVSDSGSTFQSIPHKDFWQSNTHVIKKFLEARKDENYGIVIKNHSSERVGVVIAVDGRNIITGKRSELKNNEGMYVVHAYDTVRYTGWRTGQDKVHRFYFTDVADSYSVRTFSDSSAMGVIAVAVYREKQKPQPVWEQRKEEKADSPAPSARASKSADKALVRENAGTGFGDAHYSPVITVQFDPERKPIQKNLIKYEWRDVLCKKRILLCSQEYGNRLWDEDRYAPNPPGYPKN
ncbi:MAG: hypothetical protein WC539_02685 [Nitrospirota bacterium]